MTGAISVGRILAASSPVAGVSDTLRQGCISFRTAEATGRDARFRPNSEWAPYQRLRHVSKAQPFQCFDLPPYLVERVAFIDIVSLEEAVELKAGFDAEETLEFGLGEMTVPVFVSGERFKRPA